MEEEQKPAASLREYLRTARESIEVFHWLWREVRTTQSIKKLVQMFGALGIVIILSAIQPYAINFVISGLSVHDYATVRRGIITFFVCQLLLRIVECFQESAREWVLGINWCRLDDRITEMFFGKSLGQHIHEGMTLSTSNIDKGRWQALAMQGMIFFDGLPTLFQILVAVIFVTYLNAFCGLVLMCVLSVYFSWTLFLNLRVNQECTPIDRDFRALNRRRVERWDRVERVKVCGKETEEISTMSVEFATIMERDRNFWLWFIRSANFREMVNALGLLAIMIWGAHLVWIKHLPIGLLYPLYAWSAQVSQNIWRIGSIERQISWSMPAVKSMIKALSIPPAIVESATALDIDDRTPHRIEFKDMSHTYPADGKNTKEPSPVLVKINFSIGPGERVALLGQSGAGKTTVMKNLLMFNYPTVGSILVDDVDLRNIREASWRKGIGYIPQQSQVFDGTIRYNLTYRLTPAERAAISDQQIWHLMRLLQIDFKDRLTQGLDTVVGKNGIKLSGGQAQRLMIGAAVIKRPWLLVVDEATSSLDSVTEMDVQAGLSTVLEGSHTSALIVAHRLSTVRRLCSKFVVLKTAAEVVNGDSQVEAIAHSFEELYSLSPTFRRLADYQGVAITS